MSTTRQLGLMTALLFLEIALFSFAWKKWIIFSVEKYFHPKYHITCIEQTSPTKEALTSSFFAEALDLSAERPVSKWSLQPRALEAKLLQYPFMKTVKVSMKGPQAVSIQYEVRAPLAVLADFHGAWIDNDRMVFPIFPFFTTKKVPRFFLGWRSLPENEKPVRFELARRIMQIAGREKITGMALDWVDVSKAYQPSLGEREIVIGFKSAEGSSMHYIRTGPKKVDETLRKYACLLEKNPDTVKNNLTCDFRIDELAFVEKF